MSDTYNLLCEDTEDVVSGASRLSPNHSAWGSSALTSHLQSSLGHSDPHPAVDSGMRFSGLAGDEQPAQGASGEPIDLNSGPLQAFLQPNDAWASMQVRILNRWVACDLRISCSTRVCASPACVACVRRRGCRHASHRPAATRCVREAVPMKFGACPQHLVLRCRSRGWCACELGRCLRITSGAL